MKRKSDINLEILTSMRKQRREEEIQRYGKPIVFRPMVVRSKKQYDRKRMKNFCITD